MLIDNFTGVILAGGQSRRFGTNKALTSFRGRKLIEHPAFILERIFSHRLLVTNSAADYDFLGWPVTGDIFPGCGPLAGIHAALDKSPTKYIFAAGCDMPDIHQELIEYLCGLAGGYDGVVPWTEMGPEPLHSIYCRSASKILEQALRDGSLRTHDVFQAMNIRKVHPPEIANIVGSARPFRNINTVSDMEEA